MLLSPIAGRVRLLTTFARLCAFLFAFGICGSSTFAAPPAAEAPWHAQWIGVAAPTGDAPGNQWSCFRRTFTLPARPPKTAVARIAVDSKYWLWVNGKLIVFEGGLKRGPNPSDTYYDAVDLAPYLTAGTNTLAVLTWYWGRDGFSHKSSGRAGFLFDLPVGDRMILSDHSWRAVVHPAFGKAGGKQPNFRLAESPIHFDARNDLGDWSSADFDDSAWQPATEWGAAGGAPWNGLQVRPIPQWRDYGVRDYPTIDPEVVANDGGRKIVAHLPYNAQVTPYLKIDAESAGLPIDIDTDDPLNEIHTEYVTRAGVQEFEGFAWMNGHSVIYHLPPGVKVVALKYRETGYDTDLSGQFSSDDPFLDTIWKKSQRTLYVTMRDNYMDCPDRERGQWWGDAVNEIGESFYALSPSSGLLARKAMLNLADWQKPDGVLYAPVPAGNWDKELPPQMLASVGYEGFDNYYRNTGDSDTIAHIYPAVRKYLALYQTDADGLIAHRPGGWDWEDWGDQIDSRVLDNAWFCLALRGAADMARVAGKRDEAAAYDARRAALAAAISAHLWNGSAYRTPGYTGATDDRGNALMVVAGVADPAKWPAITTVLGREYHASPYMEKYVLEALCEMGDTDSALARMHRRYEAIVASPLTTLPENWDGGGTDNHAWSGGPLTILSQYIAGIAPTSPGWRTFDITPRLGTRLRHVHAVVDSPRGKIDVVVEHVSNFRGRFMLKLKAPRGTTAIVSFPTAEYGEVSSMGRPLWHTGGPERTMPLGVSYVGIEGGMVRFAVTGGDWEFHAN